MKHNFKVGDKVKLTPKIIELWSRNEGWEKATSYVGKVIAVEPNQVNVYFPGYYRHDREQNEDNYHSFHFYNISFIIPANIAESPLYKAMNE